MSDSLYSSATTHHLMQESGAFLQQGREDQALICLKKILALRLDFFTLGMTGLHQALQAKTAAMRAFAAIVLKTQCTDHQIDFAHAVSHFRLDQTEETIEQAVLLCLSNPFIQPQLLTRAGLSLLRHKGYSPHDPLLLSLLQTVLPDPHLENFLKAERTQLLLHAADPEWLAAYHSFIYGLAAQCSMNEYVYTLTDDENTAVEQLLEHIRVRLPALDAATKLLIALLSCYRPLYDTPLQPVLATLALAGEDPAFAALLKRQIFDRLREKAILPALPLLQPIEDAISQKVRQQYEEHPYPRWTRLEARDPIAFQAGLAALFPQLKGQLGSQWPTDLSVLVAGCGTGQQAINCALNYAKSHVTAVDLSLASLAYAQRMAEDMGVNNVTFLQGDILNLALLPTKFDVIECSGVLHHMQDPVAGWRVLTDLLHAKGWMNIGLYSQIAREKIAAARAYVVQSGYAAGTQADIRHCRQAIFDKPDSDAVKAVLLWQDFYTTSTCRDLLFHVHEVHFNLLQIAEILQQLNLEFIGFDLPVTTQAAYQKMFPEDPWMVSLANWHQFEQVNPASFATMYQFWVRKR